MVNNDIETRLLRLFSEYVGKSVNAIEKGLGEHLNPDSKNYCSILCGRILQTNPQLYMELRSEDISVKTVRVVKGGSPKESMSFPAFHFNDILQQEWETSDFRRQLSSRFLFVVFNIQVEGDRDYLILSNAGFWSIPGDDLDRISYVWEDTKKKIDVGDFNHFISKTQNPFAHIRPHATNSSQTEEFRGQQVKKFGFWLNSNYINEILCGLPPLVPKELEVPTEDDTVRGYIIRVLYESPNPVPHFKLKTKVLESFPDYYSYTDALTGLVNTGVVENTSFGFRLKVCKLKDMLLIAPGLVKQYFDCESPEQLADSLHKPLEDLEIEVRAFFTVRPEEDCYAEDFSKYQFTPRQFMQLYYVNPTVYRYLSLMHPKGWKSPSELLQDPSKSDSFKVKLQTMMFNKTEIDGTVVELNESGILYYILSNAKKEMLISELVRKYNAFAKEHNVVIKDILTTNASRIKILSDIEGNRILKTSANSVKYFPYDKSEVYNLLAKMNLGLYKDMYVAAELLRTDNPELMEEYGLKHENEIYFLFFKYRYCKILVSNRVTFPGMPSIKFGEGDISNQLKELLSETGRITKNEFCALYRQRYGTKEASVKAYMSKFPEYSNGEYYDINLPQLDDEVIGSLKDWFKSPAISLTVAKGYFRDAESKHGFKVPDGETDPYFNSKNLSQLGYKISQGAIFFDKYDSLSDCI